MTTDLTAKRKRGRPKGMLSYPLGPMDPQHEAFAQNLATGDPTVEAYRKAGFQEHSTPRRTVIAAAKMKATKSIVLRVRELQENALAHAGVDRPRLLREIASIAHSRITDVVQWDGDSVTVTPSDALPDHVIAAIRKVSVKKGKDGTWGGIEVEFWNKPEALEKLARALGVYNNIDDGNKSPMTNVTIVMPDGTREVESLPMPNVIDAESRVMGDDGSSDN